MDTERQLDRKMDIKVDRWIERQMDIKIDGY